MLPSSHQGYPCQPPISKVSPISEALSESCFPNIHASSWQTLWWRCLWTLQLEPPDQRPVLCCILARVNYLWAIRSKRNKPSFLPPKISSSISSCSDPDVLQYHLAKTKPATSKPLAASRIEVCQINHTKTCSGIYFLILLLVALQSFSWTGFVLPNFCNKFIQQF